MKRKEVKTAKLKFGLVRKGIVYLVLASLLSCMLAWSASAYTLYGYRLNGGVGRWGSFRRYYWLSSLVTPHAHTIESAVNSWIYTDHILSTSISWRRTMTQSEATVDTYGYFNGSSDSENGYTTFWLWNYEVNPRAQNWGWCEIHLNGAKANEATMVHEMGHAMGLDHTNNVYVIMYPWSSDRKVSTPQLDDLRGIAYLYP